MSDVLKMWTPLIITIIAIIIMITSGERDLAVFSANISSPVNDVRKEERNLKKDTLQ